MIPNKDTMTPNSATAAATSFANPTASVGLTAVNGTAVTAMRSDAAPALDQTAAYVFTGLGATTISANGAASTSGLILTGTVFGGTGTTSFPLLLVQPSTATASITWNASGTVLGVNAHAGIGNLFDLQTDGASKFSVGATGSVVLAGNLVASGNIQAAATGQLAFGARGILSSPVAGTNQLGAANAASPVNQTLQAQGSRAGTDSNVGGANLTIQAGAGTGTGTESHQTFKTPIKVASGSGAQTMLTALDLFEGVPAIPSYAFASLPTAPVAGMLAYITDSTTAAWGATVAGSGVNPVLAWYNGAHWTVIGA